MLLDDEDDVDASHRGCCATTPLCDVSSGHAR